MTVPAPAPLVLSLFPGLGFLDRAFEAEGFCVVRGPDVIWGGDVRAFSPPPGCFDGVIGGPPCQAFSSLRHLTLARGGKLAANLIPEFERIVAASSPRWWVMENVPAAPEPAGARGRVILRDCDCGGLTPRPRAIAWGGIDLDLWFQNQGRPCHPALLGAPLRVKRRDRSGELVKRYEENLSAREALRRQGFPPRLLDGCPLTEKGKRKAIGNGVPLAMGLAIARSVRRALELAPHA